MDAWSIGEYWVQFTILLHSHTIRSELIESNSLYRTIDFSSRNSPPDRLSSRCQAAHYSAVLISRVQVWFSRYQSTTRAIPSANLTVGPQFNSSRALVMFAHVAGTSAGWAGLVTIRAVLPTSCSTVRIMPINSAGESDPR